MPRRRRRIRRHYDAKQVKHIQKTTDLEDERSPPDLDQQTIIPHTQQNLSPQIILALQRQHGNRATRQLLAGQNDSPSLQRKPGKNAETLFQGTNKGVTGGIKLGTQIPGTLLQGTGAKAGLTMPGVGVDAWNVGVSGAFLSEDISKLTKAGKDLKKTKGDKSRAEILSSQATRSAYATIKQLEKDRANARKGVFTNTSGVLGGLSSIVSGIAKFINILSPSEAAKLVSGVSGYIGSGLSILTGLVGAVSDSVSLFKRGKRSKASGKVLHTYEAIAGTLQGDIATKKQAVMRVLEGGGDRNKANAASLMQIAGEIAALEQRTSDAMRIATALRTARRKQGGVLKGVSLGSNILSIGGSAVGIAAIATAGTAAASVLGPVGWAIGGALLISGLAILIGTQVKKKVRADNVKRMTQEKALIEKFLQNPTSKDQKYKDWSRRRLLQLPWYRKDFPTDKKRGLKIGPRKSGKITIGERLLEIETYLGKYDKEAAGEAIWEGFLAAVDNQGKIIDPELYQGSQQVPNPDDKSKNIELREMWLRMLKKFFPTNYDAFLASALSKSEKRREEAKKLLLGRMKVG